MWKNEGEDSLSGTSGVAGELFASAFGLAPVTTKCAQLGWLDSKSPSFVSTLAKRYDRIVSLPVLFRDVLDGTMIKKTKKKNKTSNRIWIPAHDCGQEHACEIPHRCEKGLASMTVLAEARMWRALLMWLLLFPAFSPSLGLFSTVWLSVQSLNPEKKEANHN